MTSRLAKGLTIERRGCAPRFFYVDVKTGRRLSGDQVERIKSLAIPPAWREVRIAASAGAKVQAVGYDAAGRLQYRYAVQHREKAERSKFARMPAFAAALAAIRRRAREDLRQPGLPRDKVLAAVVLVLDRTFIRIGSEEYARKNGSFGLTTLEDRHAKALGPMRVRFDFKGKSGIRHAIDLKDPVLARVVRACRDLPGSQLFQYVDEEGTVRDVKAGDVNRYLKEISGEDFTAKDFRTWAGTALACALLRRCEHCTSKTAANRKVVEIVREVARHLGNTPAVCRKSYIHPGVIEAYVAGELGRSRREVRNAAGHLDSGEEREVRRLLGRAA